MTAFVIGLTGQIGAGKSTVAALLREKGAKVLDADELARDERTRGTLGYTAIVQQFGTEILGPDKEIDRAKLAAIVFADPAQLRRLEQIIQPRVIARLLEARGMLADSDVLVVEMIKLFENPLLHRACDRSWVVVAPRGALLSRLAENRGMSEGEAGARLSSQMSEEDLRRRADVVIENDGDREKLRAAVDAAWASLRAPRRSG